MSTLEVCFVRHAQSVSNAAGIWQGHGNSPLSEVGRTQVEALQRALEGQQFDLVLSSDLSRAADTSAASGAKAELDPAWREIDVGDWEGLTMEQVVARFPEQIESLKARQSFSVGGGESWPDVFARTDEALRSLRNRFPAGGRAIVFTHGGVIAALLAGLIGARSRWPWPLGRMRNTGRTTLRFRGDQIELVGHNDDSHVQEEHRQIYEPRDDQTVLRLISSSEEGLPTDPASLDFNSAIKVARRTGSGGVMSLDASSAHIASLTERAAAASSKNFRFVELQPGSSTHLLVSARHQMLLDYGLPIFQI